MNFENEIENSRCWVIQGGGGSSLELNRKISKSKKSLLTLQLSLVNKSNFPIRINSLVVADFTVPKNPDLVLENSWTQSGFSGYTNGIKYTKKKRNFLMRDQNPYSLRRDYGYLDGSQISEWYAQLVFNKQSLVFGATTIKNQYTQIFIKKDKFGTKVRVTCQLDKIEIEPGESVDSEKIVFIEGGKEETLGIFADLIKKENRIQKLQKPVRGLCCAYYFQGNYVDEDYVLKQLDAIDNFSKKVDFNVVQIDGLPTPWGDWEESWNRLFPQGLNFIVKEIKKRGLKAGFWIAPYVASPNSKLFKRHKDWFLKNDNGIFFESRLTSPFDYLPSLSFRALDPTHPQVQNYITKTIKRMISCGFSYIKTDFSYPMGFTTRFYKNTTRAQALREGFEVIRNAAGKDVLIQSCITQISPLVGIVDFVRTGIDSLNPFVCKIPLINKVVNETMMRQNLRSSEARNFLHNKVWVADPDCVIFRKGTGIGESLIKRHKDFVIKNKTSRWIGDNLTRLDVVGQNNLHQYLNEK